MTNETKELITSIRKNELEFPSEVSVTYANIDNDYQVGSEYARRLTAVHENKVVINLPLALTATEAAKIADIALNSAWYTGRYSYTFSSNYNQLRLSPGDLVTIPLNTGRTELVKIISIEYGPTGLITYEAVPELPSLYTSTVGGTNIVNVGQSLLVSGPTELFMLDCPLLRDEDNSLGWYAGMSGFSAGWKGGLLFKSLDAGATYVSALVVSAADATGSGITGNTLGTGSTTCFDTQNTLNITLSNSNSTLTSATLEAVLNGANAILVGAHGRWELLQFKDVIDNGNNSYTISNLLRGRKGTEWAVSTHTSSDKVILLDTNLNNLITASSELAAPVTFKSVTAGTSLEEASPVNYTYTGERLECLSPINLRSYRSTSVGNYDIIINWTRRDRINAGWNNNADIPMSESIEKYKIEFYTAADFLTKTVYTLANSATLDNLATPTFTYTAAMQLTSGELPNNGVVKTTIYVRVYQVSSITGPGRHVQGTLVPL